MKKIADTIENATNGKPLQNATVSLTIGGVVQPLYLTNVVGSPVYSVLTDADGYYEFYAPDGVYSFNASYGDTSKTVDDFEVYDESEQRAVIAALPVFASGAYTPTLTALANLDDQQEYISQYMRVGSVVTVSGRVDINPTATTFTDLAISLPIASNFTTIEQCSGVGGTNSAANGAAIIKGDISGNYAVLSLLAPVTTEYPVFYTFTYQVI
ncbi:MAG: hypothetical protein AAB263_14305 [Planctomycetota bacterium]